ncbi:MAG: ATP-grasp fold amidoligase family protein [Candidatus Ornithospirochaeta sp.]
MEDRKYLELRYRMIAGKELNLDNPRSFDDKLQWLKLYDHNPFYTSIVDKYEAKKYISDKVGESYVPKLYGVWDKYDDIDFDSLPSSFVLKCTHDSGGVVICPDKSNFDFNKAKKVINRSMNKDFYLQKREWPYKDVKHRIIAEEFLADDSGEEEGLMDYKFLCFNGQPKVMYIGNDIRDDSHEDFFDMDFNHLSLQMGYSMAPECPKRPKSFDKMKELAEVLSKDFLHIRVDFFEIDGRPYVGELTFFQNEGITMTTPPEWDERLASWIDLDSVKRSKV